MRRSRKRPTETSCPHRVHPAWAAAWTLRSPRSHFRAEEPLQTIDLGGLGHIPDEIIRLPSRATNLQVGLPCRVSTIFEDPGSDFPGLRLGGLSNELLAHDSRCDFVLLFLRETQLGCQFGIQQRPRARSILSAAAGK